ncbi:PIN domain-containing protein [Pseudomonas sp. NPDC088444]|uniref:PIN domain-containing protein n=1 Tax=Pseudomonas sp. NPDC088444 TaxID=3364456 RepID=UPI00384F01DF
MRNTSFTALLDANVLYPAPLRDLLLRVALTGIYRARWTIDIHDEWKRNLLKNRPDLSPQHLDRTSTLMDQAIPDALITDYHSLIAGLDLPDNDDRHVLAAAIKGGAAVIVTANGKDFPDSILEPYAVEAIHPDEFLVDLWDLDQAALLKAAAEQRRSLKKPPLCVNAYLDMVRRQGLAQTVKLLSRCKHVL